MKCFLARFTIYDGEHEHRGEFVVKAKSLDTARHIAMKEQHDVGSDGAKTWWDYGDGQTASTLKSIEEIKKSEAEVLDRLCVAYFYN
ncbi:MAG: hypothetical protein IPM53_17975 [Anaerolineaceae bacterium]|nr:hypothetical protein [Anaerolineaceae bacterium]